MPSSASHSRSHTTAEASPRFLTLNTSRFHPVTSMRVASGPCLASSAAWAAPILWSSTHRSSTVPLNA